jgi:putative serine protease PepD
VRDVERTGFDTGRSTPPTPVTAQPPYASGPPPSWPDPAGGVGTPASVPTLSSAPWPSPAVSHPPPSRRRRGWLVPLSILGAAALVGAGIAAGMALDEDPVRLAQSVDVPLAAVPSTGTIEDRPGPVDPAGADEPIAAVAEAVLPSVVRVEADSGQGSGIVYDATGLILTNAHVVAGSREVAIQLADGRVVPAEVIGSDDVRDVAVIQVSDTTDLVPAIFAPLSTVDVGQTAVAIGSPFGLDQTVTAGIVSAVGRVVPSFGNGRVAMIQTDAPINPGNSGGALADIEGRVIGMNTSIRTDGTNGNQGVGFAVPAETLELVAQRIVNGESLETGFLGVEGVTPTDGHAGALVTGVRPDTPAEAAGLQEGDLVVEFGGVPVTGIEPLAAQVQLQTPGSVVDVVVIRGEERIVVRVTLGAVG